MCQFFFCSLFCSSQCFSLALSLSLSDVFSFILVCLYQLSVIAFKYTHIIRACLNISKTGSPKTFFPSLSLSLPLFLRFVIFLSPFLPFGLLFNFSIFVLFQIWEWRISPLYHIKFFRNRFFFLANINFWKSVFVCLFIVCFSFWERAKISLFHFFQIWI